MLALSPVLHTLTNSFSDGILFYFNFNIKIFFDRYYMVFDVNFASDSFILSRLWFYVSFVFIFLLVAR